MFQAKEFWWCLGFKLASFFSCIRYWVWASKLTWMIDEDGKVHCYLLINRSCVTPLKFVSVPSSKLTAAVLSVKTSQQLKQELDIAEDISVEEFFWADSQVVLKYISNESKRFKVFVANNVQMIRNKTNLSRGNYMTSADNPAVSASRRLNTVKEAKVRQWFEGSAFPKLLKNSWNHKFRDWSIRNSRWGWKRNWMVVLIWRLNQVW